MNATTARTILGIDNGIQITPELLKRQYRIYALRYHPDKNSSPNANDQFRLVREAYELLSETKSPNLSYVDILKEFLNTKSPVLHIIITKLSQMCEEKASRFINSIDKLILMDIYKLLIVHRELLYIPDILIEEIHRILIMKTKQDERIIVNPTIEDLLHDNVYKLVIDERTYMVPLWHHELIYDNSGCDLYVNCIPMLPDNIEIDPDNNIIVALSYNVSDLLQTDTINVPIGGRELTFRPDELRIIGRQCITRTGIGASRIKHNNVYDVSSRGDIILDIRIQV